ncbi:MAG TPA: hypothetical protein VFJ88_09450 [Chthoniobacterales bacterium]|nr:hypothetical protein [Chthoniobacterales bacterium]
MPPKLRLEIGHVLFLDIVGYSKLLISEQSAQLQKLKEIMRATEQFRSAEAEGKLLRLPTGDGGALVFRKAGKRRWNARRRSAGRCELIPRYAFVWASIVAPLMTSAT